MDGFVPPRGRCFSHEPTPPPEQPPHLSLTLLGPFQEVYNEKKTTAIPQKLRQEEERGPWLQPQSEALITLQHRRGRDPALIKIYYLPFFPFCACGSFGPVLTNRTKCLERENPQEECG